MGVLSLDLGQAFGVDASQDDPKSTGMFRMEWKPGGCRFGPSGKCSAAFFEVLLVQGFGHLRSHCAQFLLDGYDLV